MGKKGIRKVDAENARRKSTWEVEREMFSNENHLKVW